MPNTSGTIRLFQIAGIQVFLHWSWFLVAVYEVQGKGRYSSLSWNILEYLALFAIVTMHEFGHALACRQVGGRADQIVLWPLGGVAYVDPPARPGANLWSVSAGPLVNLALAPILGMAWFGLSSASGPSTSDLSVLVQSLNWINLGLFLFNVLPIYPLDGGKILRSLLWYVVGRARSLMISVIVGFIGVAGLGLFALFNLSFWFGVITVFAAMQCINGYKVAQSLKKLEDLPRREGFACPTCKANPPRGALWACGICKTSFDTFEVNARCPKCYTTFPKTTCTECGMQSAFSDWFEAGVPAVSEETPTQRAMKPLTSPSIIPVVLGVVASLGALVLLLPVLLFLYISTDDAARQPEYQAEMDLVWQSEGMAVPGEQTLLLKGDERYDAYIEGSATDSANVSVINIHIKDAVSGVSVPVSPYSVQRSLQRNNRKLSPTASFSVPKTGSYTVQASSGTGKAIVSRLKIGPTIGLVNGNTAKLGRGVAIGAGILALALAALAVLLFIIYAKKRRDFRNRL